MPLIALIALCAVFYAGFEIFAALAGGNINGWLAAVLYNGIGTLIPLIVYIGTTANKGKTTWKGILFAAIAGIAIMLFSVLLANIFNRGGNLSYVIPVIYGSAIVISSIFGIFVLKDKVNLIELAGLGLIVLGVGLVVLARSKIA